MPMTVAVTPEMISLAHLAETDAKKPILNNLYAHRLREKERDVLKNFIDKRVETLYSEIMEFDAPYLKEETANIKKLIEEYGKIKSYKESILEMPLILATAGIVSPLCAGVAGALYLIADGVRKVHVIPYLTAEKLAKVCDVFWEDLNKLETVFSDKGRIFEVQKDEKRVEALHYKIRLIAIVGKIIELDQKNEENAILKVLSEFVKFKEEDLKQFACSSSEKQYYQDGTECHVYKKILKMQRNQWSDNPISKETGLNTLIKIIDEVARHSRKQRVIEGEIEAFWDYCAQEIPQEVDTAFKLEVEKQFVVL